MWINNSKVLFHWKKGESTGQVQENEQWKLYGYCEKCRRNNYCATPCTHHNRRIRAEFKGLVADTMNKMTGGVMRESIDKTVNGIW